MGDSMDLSLDEIIATRGSSRPRGRGGRRHGTRRNDMDGESSSGPMRSRRNRGSERPYSRGNVEGQWTNDLFEGDTAPNPRSSGPRGASESHRIRIENLHWNVTEADINGLMGSLGHPVKKVKLFYDNAGRSEGKAEVIFETEEGAIDAISTYNGRELDGMAMQMTLISSRHGSGRGSSGVTSRLGPKHVSVLERLGKKLDERLGPKVGQNTASHGTRASRVSNKRPLNQTQLDAELDSYLKGEPMAPAAPVPTHGGYVDLDKQASNAARQIISYDDVTPAKAM
ncbi:hypothetical protein BC832DRAFT_564398 [Gaertneriomyces semiglobifer]|nr:hypothetical protein BC832DRAFT_564398 [Gaertneriomyces semiglobifer]